MVQVSERTFVRSEGGVVQSAMRNKLSERTEVLSAATEMLSERALAQAVAAEVLLKQAAVRSQQGWGVAAKRFWEGEDWM